MAKTFSYKVYHNKRLKTVEFLGSEIFPLYVQIVKNGTPIYFKSQIFNQLISTTEFSKFYNLDIEKVIDMELELLTFVNSSLIDEQQLSDFKILYESVCRDIIVSIEEPFKIGLRLLFSEMELKELGRNILERKNIKLKILIEELISSFNKNYSHKLENFLEVYPIPYFELIQFAKERYEMPIFPYFKILNKEEKSILLRFIDEKRSLNQARNLIVKTIEYYNIYYN